MCNVRYDHQYRRQGNQPEVFSQDVFGTQRSSPSCEQLSKPSKALSASCSLDDEDAPPSGEDQSENNQHMLFYALVFQFFQEMSV